MTKTWNDYYQKITLGNQHLCMFIPMSFLNILHQKVIQLMNFPRDRADTDHQGNYLMLDKGG